MSLSPHQRGNISNIVKQNIESLEQPTQHSGEAFYNVGASSLEQTHSSSGGKLDPSVDLQGSASFKSEKGYQVWGHFQQPGPVKWVHQDPVHTSTWFQGMANPTKVTQKFGVDDTQSRQALHKANHDMDPLQQEKMSTASSVPYSEPSQSVAPGMEWDHHTMAAVHHAQFQALQQGHKPGDSQYQRHAMRHAMPDSTLQSFQLAFGPTKQPPASGFYPAFHGNSASQNLGYSEQTKSQQQLFQLQQQQLQHHQQQIQLQQMHQLQQQQQQQQQMHLMQQQYQKQKMQEQMQQMQKQQQQQQMQNLPQPFVTPQHQQDQKPTRPQQDERQLKADSSSPPQLRQATAVHPQTQDPIPMSPADQDFCSGQPSQEPQETQGKHVLPRRSRRLSKDGTSPVSSQPSKEPARNGGVSGHQGPSVGVIQSTQRRRRTSKEINLETLAQKASEMEFLPAKHDESGSSKPGGMGPLVIPVSVPVRRNQGQMDLARSWGHEQRPLHQFQTDRKPSVIVARRRSLRNSTSDSFNQDEEKEDGTDKVKRRPRPEPLVIPPPRPCTFIAPSVYSSITPYQSHLRSPVRTLEHPLVYPPYTPPPILSPVREGSGLYFSAFLSSMAAGSQGMPLPPTPKTANRSLLHSSSSDMTPPVLPLGEATPVSLEPRINIGSHYQAEIPELQDPSLALQDEDKATLVWVPLPADKSTPSQEETVENLMNMACSSVLCGGGTNVELMHHCLHENSGDVVKTLDSLLMKNPLFSKNHHLSNYHYAGSDCWTVDEKRYFNKGISAYRKDFFLVQKLVRSKTVAQCVEFYYTYKKQVKVARNGTLLYGPPEVNDWSSETVQKQEQPEAVESKQKGEQEDVGSDHLKTLTQALQVNEIEGKTLVLSIPKIGFGDDGAVLKRETQTPPLPVPKPRPEGSAGKRSKPSTTSKTQGEPEGIFPCKKCGRVFYKVKSRSAHMKSHAEQEKKAAAQRQREEEERAAARARQEAAISQRMRAEGERELPESSEEEEIMAEPEDERDEDWR